MVVSIANGTFDAPMPGQSLTQTPGASPNEHPPKFVQVDDALDFIWGKLHKPKSLTKLVGYLKTGMPVEVYARTIIYQGLMKNLWSVDVALLMLQTVIWQIEAIAKLKKIKVQTFVDDTDHTKGIITIGNMLDSKQKQDTTMDSIAQTNPSTGFKGFF